MQYIWLERDKRMNGISEMCEIIPGLLLGGVRDAGEMARKGADVLVPLAFLDSGIWQTGFRGEILYYPIPDRGRIKRIWKGS